MSRTYKDKPSRLKYDRYDKDMIVYSTEEICREYAHELRNGEIVEVPLEKPYVYNKICYIYGPTSKPKKRKEHDVEWHWMATPSWWTRLTMNRPQRRKGRLWERKVLLEDVEEADPPGVSKKPHKYYW